MHVSIFEVTPLNKQGETKEVLLAVGNSNCFVELTLIDQQQLIHIRHPHNIAPIIKKRKTPTKYPTTKHPHKTPQNTPQTPQTPQNILYQPNTLKFIPYFMYLIKNFILFTILLFFVRYFQTV